MFIWKSYRFKERRERETERGLLPIMARAGQAKDRSFLLFFHMGVRGLDQKWLVWLMNWSSNGILALYAIFPITPQCWLLRTFNRLVTCTILPVENNPGKMMTKGEIIESAGNLVGAWIGKKTIAVKSLLEAWFSDVKIVWTWNKRKEWVKNAWEVSNKSDFKGEKPISKDQEEQVWWLKYVGIRNVSIRILVGYSQGDTCQAICWK